MITKDDLQPILTDTECYRIERTTSTSDADKHCQAICAFSNDLSGNGLKGYLILGVHNDGTLSGLKVEDKLLLQISNIRTDGNILPQPVMNVEKFSFDDGDVLVAEVQPSEFPPVRYRGRIWVRVGPRKSMATEAEEKILMERRLSNVRSFDAMPCLRTTIADLDVTLIKKEFLPQAIAEEVLAEDKRPIEEQLASLGFYDLRYNCPTTGAIILFGKNPERYLPGSYVQYVRFNGKSRAGEIINEHKFSGNLCKELAKIDTFIETSISQKRPIPVSVLREETVSKYPYWATRELMMNAVMHRDYETNSPVQFYEYDDRIEVLNPGGLYGKVSPENFPNVSDYRNPYIAEAIKILGYVNRFSRGIYRVQKELIENGNGEASFDFSLITAFRVVENVSVRYFEIGFGLETTQEYPENSNDTQENCQKTPKKHMENTQNTEDNGLENRNIHLIEDIENTTQKHPENIQKTPRKQSETTQKPPRNHPEITQKLSDNNLENSNINLREDVENTTRKHPETTQKKIKNHPKTTKKTEDNNLENSSIHLIKNAENTIREHPENIKKTSKKHPENTQKIEDNNLENRNIHLKEDVENTTQKHSENTKKTPKKHQKNTQKIKEFPQNQISLAIKSNPYITRSGLAGLLNRSQDSIKHHLLQLNRKGVIKREGSNRSGKWIILKIK